jgi:hypothetical protein
VVVRRAGELRRAKAQDRSMSIQKIEPPCHHGGV